MDFLKKLMGRGQDAPQSPNSPSTRDFTAERDAEVIPAARELLARLAVRRDLLMGSVASVNKEKAAEYYQKVYQEDIVPLMLARNLRLKDVPFMFSLMMQPIQLLNDLTTSSFKMNRDIADAKKWGVEDADDIRVNDLQAVLTGEPVENTSAEVTAG